MAQGTGVQQVLMKLGLSFGLKRIPKIIPHAPEKKIEIAARKIEKLPSHRIDKERDFVEEERVHCKNPDKES